VDIQLCLQATLRTIELIENQGLGPHPISDAFGQLLPVPSLTFLIVENTHNVIIKLK
jgi:hypothetical protein